MRWDRMPFSRKKKKTKSLDPTTKKLIDKGVIKVNSSETKSKKKSNAKAKLKKVGEVTYDFWGGVKYILVLSAVLWWLPLFGPMLAGYVGGRRTGGPKRGLIASILGVAMIGGIHYALTMSLFPQSIHALFQTPEAALGVIAQERFFAPYVRFVRLYWSSFFGAILGGLPYSPNSYILTIIFAYVGGMVSVDKKRELSRAEEGENTVQINVPTIISGSSKKRTAEQRRRNVSAAGNAYSSNRASAQQRLEDLKAIQFKRDQPSKSRADAGKKPREISGAAQADDGAVRRQTHEWKVKKREELPKRPVRHHSSSSNDDWEIL